MLQSGGGGGGRRCRNGKPTWMSYKREREKERAHSSLMVVSGSPQNRSTLRPPPITARLSVFSLSDWLEVISSTECVEVLRQVAPAYRQNCAGKRRGGDISSKKSHLWVEPGCFLLVCRREWKKRRRREMPRGIGGRKAKAL